MKVLILLFIFIISIASVSAASAVPAIVAGSSASSANEREAELQNQQLINANILTQAIDFCNNVSGKLVRRGSSMPLNQVDCYNSKGNYRLTLAGNGSIHSQSYYEHPTHDSELFTVGIIFMLCLVIISVIGTIISFDWRRTK